jgi:tetratricopeptide (TPR) repeat protein
MSDVVREQSHRRILVIWATIVLAGYAVVLLSNVPLLRYGQYLREHDYRTYLAAADETMKLGDLTGALQRLERAFELAPADASLPYKVSGDVYYNFRKWDLAVAAYEKAVTLGDREVGVRQNVVWSLVQLKRYREAIDTAEKALAEGFTYPGLTRSLAEAYAASGDDTAAAACYEKAAKDTPDDPYILERLRQVCLRLGNTAQAEALRTRVEELQAFQGPAALRSGP